MKSSPRQPFHQMSHARRSKQRKGRGVIAPSAERHNLRCTITMIRKVDERPRADMTQGRACFVLVRDETSTFTSSSIPYCRLVLPIGVRSEIRFPCPRQAPFPSLPRPFEIALYRSRNVNMKIRINERVWRLNDNTLIARGATLPTFTPLRPAPQVHADGRLC